MVKSFSETLNENRRFRFLKILFKQTVLITLLAASSKEKSFSQDSTMYYINESNSVYKSSIRTVLFHKEGWDLSPPLINQGSEEKLKLSFDDLDADKKDYLFTIVHCDAGWKPSELLQNEYIDGYSEDGISEYDFSMATLIPYTHYELIFPTDYLKPRLSGNYILKVYIGTVDSTCFTRRFMILDNKLTIDGRVKAASVIEERNYRQEADFIINTGTWSISNPFSDLYVVITQNGRWDNAIRGLKPKMVVGNKLDFNYETENLFNGGNEFRSFDIKSLKYNSEFVAGISRDISNYKIDLRLSERRTFLVYKSQDDINGMMKIKTEDSEVTETEAEYVNINFNLSYEAPFIDAGMYIIGQLTDWQFTDDSKMDYNYVTKRYQKTLLLKQGYYNYQYVLWKPDGQPGDETLVEGNHSETGNTYTIYVYYTGVDSNCDRLVGVKHLNSLD
jgi:hypothetical protein